MGNRETTYKQIIKSTGIFGGVQLINIVIGFLRAKAGALLLGTAGIGIIGIFQNIIDLVRSISNLGIDTGAVKDIAYNSDNPQQQQYSISVFRWWMLLTACSGSLICIIFCRPISLWAFGNGSYSVSIALLSAAVFFTSLSFGQSVILQGLRQISLMAKASLLGNIAGLFISIACYFVFGLKGVIPAFILSGVALYFFTRISVRKINIAKVEMSHKAAFEQGMRNLRLGLFLVAASVVNTASMFMVRSFLIHSLDLYAVGIFTAVWTVTTLYPALILRSMGTDFFPRLCSVSNSNSNIRRFVNEQTYIGLLVMIPVVVIMITFSRYILMFLYSSEFVSGDLLLKWHVAGGYFKVLSWPVAFIMLAKGKGMFHLFAEIIFFGCYLFIGYSLFSSYGLLAFGLGYFLAYIIYLLIVLSISFKITSFRWSRTNILVALTGTVFIVLSFLTTIYLIQYMILGGIFISLIAICFSLFMLNKVLNIRDLFVKIKKKIFR